jgi:hypothetical protein
MLEYHIYVHFLLVLQNGIKYIIYFAIVPVFFDVFMCELATLTSPN